MLPTPQVSQSFMDDLGPLAASWMGTNQAMNQNTELGNQQNTLEQIATSRQNRDIAEQKLPFELQKMRDENEMAPLKREETRTQNQERKQKIDYTDYSHYMDELAKFQPTRTPADRSIMAQMAQRYKMDPSHEMVRQAQAALEAGPEAFKKWQEAVYAAGPEGRKAAEELKKVKEQGANTERVANIQGKTQRDVEQMRIDAGKYDKAQKDAEFFLEKALSSGNFEQAAVAYDRLAQINAAKGEVQAAMYYKAKSDEYAKKVQGKIPGTAPAPGRYNPQGRYPTNPSTPMPPTQLPPNINAMPGPPVQGAPAAPQGQRPPLSSFNKG